MGDLRSAPSGRGLAPRGAQLGRDTLARPVAWPIAAVAAALLFRFRVNSAWLDLGGAAAGWGASLIS